MGGNGCSLFPLEYQLKKNTLILDWDVSSLRLSSTEAVGPLLFGYSLTTAPLQYLMTLSLHYSPSVFICTQAPPSPVPFPCGDRERQTFLFTRGSRGLWLPISKPVWVNIWYIPWTNYLSERTLGLLSNPRLFPSGSQAGRHPLGGSARSHIGETFPKAFPVLLASQQAVTFLPSCVFHKHTRGPKGSRGQRCPFVDMLDWG